MPTYILEGTSEVQFRVRPLRLTLRVEGSSQARLEVSRNGQRQDSLVRPPDGVILPAVADLTTVSVVPVGPDRFPSPTVLHFTVSAEDKAALDLENAVLRPIDVSGLDRKDLISVDRIGDTLRLRVARHREDTDLGRLGNAARVAAREVLGVQSLDDAAACSITLAVDGSGSMGGRFEDGSVSALAQVLTGVAQVIAGSNPMLAAVVDSRFHPVPVQDLASVPGCLIEANQARIPSGGFLSAFPVLPMPRQGAQGIVYLLTDSLPADIRDLERPGEQAETRHLIAMTPMAVWELLGGTTVSHTVVEPVPAGQHLERHLLDDVYALRRLVKSLLQPCQMPLPETLKGVAL